MWSLGVLKKKVSATPVTVLDLQFTIPNGSTTFTDSSTYGATFDKLKIVKFMPV